MVEILNYFSQETILFIKNAIQDAQDNEVFFIGRLDRNGCVIEASIGARGNTNAVPVTQAAISEAEVLIHNHPSGNTTPSDADLQIASSVSQEGIGFYIINNTVTDIYVVVKPVLQREKIPLQIDTISELLSETGPLASFSEDYEQRPGQILLASSIASAFNNGLVGVFEAGTGVGKSLAYLLPSIVWALQNKERVVISTGTINLQQQLVQKDIPLSKKILGQEFSSVLMKGRQNYICKRRLAEVLQERELFEDESSALETISEWAKTSADGSRSDLSFMPPEGVWGRVCSESDACMGIRCAYHENCFVMQVRKEAANASILVVNHHLLFADLEARMVSAGYDDTAVLPPFHYIVFDEAHALEDAATSFFSEYVTRYTLLKQVSIFYRVRRGSVGGHLRALERLSSCSGEIQHAMTAIQDIKEAYTELESAAFAVLGENYSWRLCKASLHSASNLLEQFATFRSKISVLCGIIRTVLEGIDEEDQNEPIVWESKFALRRIEYIGTLALHFSEWDERRESVFWIEKIKQRDGTSLPRFVQTPLSIAPMMKEGVFEPFRTIVCVSATLRTGNTFDYWLRKTGVNLIEEDRVSLGHFESPFPYSTNVLLCIPSDAPLPDDPKFKDWSAHAVLSLLQASGGHSLVLFTAYEALRSACELARSELAPLGITVLKQGDDDRARLLSRFLEDGSSVLFATDSFWEGVDVPGESLLHVIIVKLPFRVPDNPVLAARSEAVSLRGGNPFMELSLPEAVVRFRQGFGRLMRRATDHGVVTVLDRRLIAKQYGTTFISSIPKTKQSIAPLHEIIHVCERFLWN